MAGVKKRTIVIASVLKPVNDTRMFEKIGLSLDETKQFDVHIIGYPAPVHQDQSIHIHPLPFFKRLSLKRIIAPGRILRKMIRLKPDMVIVSTHELLWAALLTKFIVRCKIIYDVQENYYRNINHTSAFPVVLRTFIALYVRVTELLTAPFIDHFFLAEREYITELKFVGSRYTVLENKLKKPVNKSIPKRNGQEKNKLLFSGTLAESTGVFTAIEIAVKLHGLNKNITLTVIGFCAQKSVLEKIRNTIEPFPYIHLIGGDQLVPHSQIMEHILLADAGIIAYPSNPSTYNSTPTKLFEYLGNKLPIILINHTRWVELCQPYNAAIIFNPGHINSKNLLEALKKQIFYVSEPYDVFWESEQPKLIRQVYQMLAK